MIKSSSSPSTPQHLQNGAHYPTVSGSSAIKGRSTSPGNSMPPSLVNMQPPTSLSQHVDLEMLTKNLKKDCKSLHVMTYQFLYFLVNMLKNILFCPIIMYEL